MYLISLYFDKNTTNKMQEFINQVADATGNTFMLDEKIPPHITLLSFETQNESEAIRVLEENAGELKKGELYFATVGAFKKSVIYVEPVLNEYLHNMSTQVCKMYESSIPDIRLGPYYKPFGWIPHLSVGKHLNETQIECAFSRMIRNFSAFRGMVTKIGIAKTNPHRDFKVIELKNV